MYPQGTTTTTSASVTAPTKTAHGETLFYLTFLSVLFSLAVYLIDILVLSSYVNIKPSDRTFISQAYGVSVLNYIYLMLAMMVMGHQVIFPKKFSISVHVIAIVLALLKITIIQLPPAEPVFYEQAICVLCGLHLVLSVAYIVIEANR